MPGERVDLKICGEAYQEGKALLAPTVEILGGYQESFNAALQIGSRRFETKDIPAINPQLSITSATPGSLDVQTVVDIAVGLVPALPDMVKYCWELYKYASELIKTAVDHFTRTGNAVNIHIDNSPDALVFYNAGNGNITVSSDIYEVAKTAHKPLNKIADQIQGGKAETIEIQYHDMLDNSVAITPDNKQLFNVKSKKVVDPGLVQITCGIYKFNKKTGNGSLDILEEETPRSVRFEVHDEDWSGYIAALGAIYSVVSATTEMKVNALGESTIQKLHLHNIENSFGKI